MRGAGPILQWREKANVKKWPAEELQVVEEQGANCSPRIAGGSDKGPSAQPPGEAPPRGPGGVAR